MIEFEPWQPRRESFEIVMRTVEPYPGQQVEVVEFLVGGRNFVDLVAAAEAADGAGEGAGHYVGLPRRGVDWRRHLLGDDPDSWEPDAGTRLMGCECLEPGCWPLYGRITLDESSVFWHDFHNPFRDWTYAELGPFRFDRVGYEEQVARLAGLD